MTRRYAEGTPVTIHASQAEIARILAAHGVKRQGWLTGPEGDQLLFELDGRSFRFEIVRPTEADIKLHPQNPNPHARDAAAKVDAEWRRRWRANVLLLKAKLEFIDSGDTTLERELLPYMLTAGGQTVAELVVAGKLPMLAAKAGS